MVEAPTTGGDVTDGNDGSETRPESRPLEPSFSKVGFDQIIRVLAAAIDQSRRQQENPFDNSSSEGYSGNS